LRQAGITSAEELRELGARRAFEKLRMTMPEEACLSKLYAIAGAIEGVRWHALSFERRAELAALASNL
jgi:DNA transformation protein